MADLRAALLAVMGLVVAGCPSVESEIEIGLLFPDDGDTLQTADNVSVSLTPGGFTETFSSDGADFSLEVELEPDDTPRELAVFWARGETLLAWGRTPPFTYGGADGSGIKIFAAFPAELTTLPLAFALTEDDVLAGWSPLRGLVAMTSDGSTVFLDAYSLDLEPATPLDTDRELPSAEDGTMVGDRFGGVNRLAWNEGLTGFRFDIPLNAWSELPLQGAVQAGARPGASWVHDREDENRFYILGGGARTDVIELELGSDDPPLRIHPTWALDAPRAGASAMLVRYDDRDPSPLLFGGDPSLPRVYHLARREAVGPDGAWTGARCVQVDPPERDPIRILCAGGLRDEMATADALVIAVARAATPTVEELVDFLPVPMPDPRWLEDDAAVYAQGEGRLVRVDRESLAVQEDVAPALRASGGVVVPFDRGLTLLVGGLDVQGAPLDRWQVFSPPPG